MDFKLPKLGEGADSGVVVNLFVKEGDTIAKDQAVLELESEKAVATVPSTVAGVVSKIYVKQGEKVSVGMRILSVGDAGAAAPAAAAPVAQPAPAASAAAAPAPTASAQATPAGGDELAPANVAPVASPSLRRMIADLGIEINRVRGTGRGGRVELGDLKNYIVRLQQLAFAAKPGAAAESGPAKPAPEQIDFSKWGPVNKKPMTSLRKTIARRMTENWNAIPHVTQFDDVDITALLDLRKKYVAAYEQKGTKLTVTSFILKAVAATLMKHPLFNSSLDEVANEIVIKEYVHVGIAVDTEAGLIVPVIRDVNKKTLLQLSKDLEEVGTKARERKVTGEDLKGGSFTISNQGAIGGGHFTPIVNKPEVAILGLGKGAFKPVVRDGKIESRMLLPIAISYDHRVADGGNAARFTVDLVSAIQNFAESDVKI